VKTEIRMDQISTPREIILSLINGAEAGAGPMQAADIAVLSMLPPDSRQAATAELAKLGFLKRSGSRYSIVAWTPFEILDHLAVAGALLSLAAYQIALNPSPAKVAPLKAINDAIKALKVKNATNLFEGAWLDFLFHRETVRQSGNAAAWAIYEPSIPAAVWLAGANYYHSEDASASITAHDRIIQYMEDGDALRARDAMAFHMEDAIAGLKRAAAADFRSYERPAGLD
jgi:DNA-binding GntR family transcriptional regulator